MIIVLSSLVSACKPRCVYFMWLAQHLKVNREINYQNKWHDNPYLACCSVHFILLSENEKKRWFIDKWNTMCFVTKCNKDALPSPTGEQRRYSIQHNEGFIFVSLRFLLYMVHLANIFPLLQFFTFHLKQVENCWIHTKKLLINISKWPPVPYKTECWLT